MAFKGWFNKNSTGNPPVYESFRHKQASKGIKTVTTKPTERRSFLTDWISKRKPIREAKKRVDDTEFLRKHGYSDDEIMNMPDDIKRNKVMDIKGEKVIETEKKVVGATAKGVVQAGKLVYGSTKWLLSKDENQDEQQQRPSRPQRPHYKQQQQQHYKPQRQHNINEDDYNYDKKKELNELNKDIEREQLKSRISRAEKTYDSLRKRNGGW